MRLLFCTVGSRGDVQPLLVLGRELRRRGHEIVFAAPPNFANFIGEAGFSFRAVGADTDVLLQENSRLAERNPLVALPEQLALVARELEAQFEQLACGDGNFDLVLSAGLGLAGGSLAELWGVPYAYVFYTLSGVPSVAHPPATLPVFGMPAWVNRGFWALTRWAFDLTLGPVLAQARERHGLGLERDAWNAIHRQRGLLVQDRIWGELPRDALSFAVQAPALLEQHDAAPRLPEDLLEFLELEVGGKARSRAIYVGFGSMPTVARERVVRAAIELHERSGRPVLLFSAHGEDSGFTLPLGVRSIGSVDHRALFPRLAVVVHHGGAGTCATALRAGTPQVIVPHIVDQFFHARRLEELGLGPPALAKSRLNGSRLHEAVELALRCTERAQAAASATTEDGPRAAALVLEGWAAQPRQREPQ